MMFLRLKGSSLRKITFVNKRLKTDRRLVKGDTVLGSVLGILKM